MPSVRREKMLPVRGHQLLVILSLLCISLFADVVCAAGALLQRQPLTPSWSSRRRVPVPLDQIRGGGGEGEEKTGGSSSAAAEGLKNSIASGLAAACSKTLLAPFDTIKTVQQQVIQQEAGGKALSFGAAARLITSRPKGFLELYAGLGVAAIGAIPSVSLYFGVYSYSKRLITPRLQRLRAGTGEGNAGKGGLASKIPEHVMSSIAIATSAAIGNTVASFSRVPYEVVKQQLQTGQYSNTWAAISTTFRVDGMRGFFPMGGVSIQMVRDIPYAIITLLAYEAIQDNWVKKSPGQEGWRDMAAGAIAGGIGSYLTNPMDVVKTRLQVNPEMYGGSMLSCAKATFSEGGAAAFLRGSVPRLMHKIPANSCFFFFYEAFKRIL